MSEPRFVGRSSELARLRQLLDEARASATGRMAVIRGRRQVGKSSLVEVFCHRSGVPFAYFTAAQQRSTSASLADFSEVIAQSGLAGAPAASTGFTSWEQALDVATNGDEPSIVVIDELPWLLQMDASIEGLLQRVWDRTLRRRPVLLLLIGSDLAMMDALTEYGRPLYDRATILRVDPLTPGDVATLTGLGPPEAIEAWAVTGGFPNIVRAWPSDASAADFLSAQLMDESSPLIVSGERKTMAEFPPEAFARPVLDAIGSGIREHGRISQRSGLTGSSLERALSMLIDKRVVVRDRPYSSARSKHTQYRIDDPHVRLWMRYVASNLPAIQRGAADVVVPRVLADWEAWKGQAIEPIVRETVLRLALRDERFRSAAHVGRWWRRDGGAEVDLVIGDDQPVARQVLALGSIKWRQREPFDARDLRELAAVAATLPGGEHSDLVAVSRVAGSADGLTQLWTPSDLIAAWAT